MTSELDETIEANAAKPKRAQVDGVSAEQHSLKDQIDAARYLRDQAAVSSKRRGLTFARLRSQGTGS